MKKILLAIILFAFFCPGADASEIFGQISTNPNAPAGETNNPLTEEPILEPPAKTTETPIVQSTGGAIVLPVQKRQEVTPAEIQAIVSEPAVLGAKIYSDGSLLRGSDKKIYLVQGRAKKLIASLEELKKYRGRAILTATAEELADLKTRGHLDGELIRQRGNIKVYVIKKGAKRHILNLTELRANYFGWEIFNISREEMDQY